jgi:type IX secretion system PorP/SprF family membrane protein
MKTIRTRRLSFTIGLLLFVWEAVAQDVPMHTQGILQQEFLNPAYNSFKENVSAAVYNRQQWGNKFEYSPGTYVANLYVPFTKTRLGSNFGVIVEDIGLRTTTEVKLSLCHNIKVSENCRWAIGYSVGFLQNSFDRDKIISYPDEDLSYLLSQAQLNSTSPTFSLGTLFLAPRWFVGLNTMGVLVTKGMKDSQYFPGFDFSAGSIFSLSPLVKFRPGVIVKYYNQKSIVSENGVLIRKNAIPVICDLSTIFWITNKIGLGTSHRVKQAQTFSLDVIIAKNMQIGYTFEWGIGSGLNQFNSQGLRLAYKFKHKSETVPDDHQYIWPGRLDQGDEKEAESATTLLNY